MREGGGGEGVGGGVRELGGGGERRVDGRAEKEQDGRTVSRLRLPVSREDHGRVLKCEARHEALTVPMGAEAALSIQCEFPTFCRL